MENRIAVVSGANRGLGFATAEALAKLGFVVVMLGRNKEKIDAAANSLIANKLKAFPFHVDVTNDEQVQALAHNLEVQFARVDVLINNAGIFLEGKSSSHQDDTNIFNVDLNIIRQTFEVNTLGPLRLTQALMPLLKKSKAGRIVNVTSHMSSLTLMEKQCPGYRISKTALNALTRLLDTELSQQQSTIKVNSICPGWVKTDMGGPDAPRSIEEGIKGIIWGATLPEEGPSGGFFQDKKPLPW